MSALMEWSGADAEVLAYLRYLVYIRYTSFTSFIYTPSGTSAFLFQYISDTIHAINGCSIQIPITSSSMSE